MPELVAISHTPGKSWRQTIPPGVVIRIGRAPRQGWMVPWDPCISREHVDLVLEGDRLKVHCLENTTNPTYYREQPIREFTIGVGESFRISSTDFHFVETQAAPPPAPESVDAAVPLPKLTVLQIHSHLNSLLHVPTPPAVALV